MSAGNVMLAVHEKATSPTDLYRPLRLYIASAYSEREAAAADDDLAAVRDLRADVEQPSLPDPSSLERRRDALLAYARALALVEPRFPASLTFTWHDAFKTSTKVSVASIHLEKAAVLFNLGAVYSQIALAADRATDVGIRTACGSLQSAAGAFAWMRESGAAAKAVAAGANTVDVTPECAALLEKLMLAQAQECFFEKVIADGKPPALCSKVARQELKGNIRVLCRVRPLLPNETGAISFPKNEESIGRGVVVSHNARTYSFTFDRVFGPTSSQEAVFSEISEVVQSALDGYKVCIFAYGQSGSGKTHTMMGNPEEIGGKRLIPRSLEQIFQTSKALNSNGWKYVIKVKMVEIYNDSICDLLGSNSTTNLTTVVVSDVNEVFHHLKQAAKRRSVGKTDINEHSSRSHAIFMLVISGVNERTGKQVEGILNMIDLAGSVRLEKSGATGDRLKESQAINKSLSSLSDVIFAIVNGDSHVPFRNSKLTYLLQPYLGGDAKTLMLVTISQDVSSALETISSLRFAALVNSCEIGNQNTRAGSVTLVSSVQRTLAVQRGDGVDVSSSALRRGSSNMYRTPSRVKFHPYLVGAAAYRGGSSKINDTPSRINQAHLPIRIPEDQSVT